MYRQLAEDATEKEIVLVDVITRYYDEKIILNRSVDLGVPEEPSQRTALLYVHGGGWARGAKDQFHYHFEHFTKQGYICASIGYRLVPEVRVREQIGDVVDGYDVCVSYLKENHPDIEKIILIGGSAGAHLASMVALNPSEYIGDPLRLRNTWMKPSACISLWGPAFLVDWPDMNAHLRTCIEDLLDTKYGTEDEIFRRYSPMTYVSDQSPPFLFLLADNEVFFPPEHIYRMSDELTRNGIYSRVEMFRNTEHGFFYNLEGVPQAQALAVMESFLEMINGM